MNETTTLSPRYAATPGLIRIALRNFGLSILTIGLYRFWARTNLRRYFWRQVTIGDEALEYTGTGKELFVGFLIVIAILAPFGLVYAVAQQLALSSPATLALVQFSTIAVIVCLSVIASFRARRYRLSRTAWRGIHAGQDGSSLGYLMRWIGWGLLSAITLGLANPWGRTALQRYLIQATRYGDKHLSFEGSGRSLFGRWLVTWIALSATFAAFGFLISGVVSQVALVAGPNTPASSPEELEQAIALAGIIRSPIWMPLLIALLLLGPLTWLWYRVREFRFFTEKTGLGDVRFRSGVKARRIGVLYFGFFVFGVVGPLLIIGALVALVWLEPNSRTIVVAQADGVSPVVLGQIGGAAFAVLMTVAANLANILWLQPRLLRHLCATLTIANPAALDTIAQSPAARQRFGEGLADSFDAGAI